jgi:hypothetical protein
MTEEHIVRSRSWIAALVVTFALMAGLPVAASAAPTTKKPHVGQRCNHKRKAPKGFRCVKSKTTGKYHLHVHKA